MEREIQRRFLAFAFYFFAALVIFGLIGSWTRWCLGGRNPWIWAVFWLTEGSARWTRPSLLFYWALLGSFSVAAWGRQLARSRKFQRSNMAMNGNGMPAGSSFADAPLPSPISNGFTHVATDLLDAADKRVPTLSLNARRKSFHAVALCMFLPGIILDVSFQDVSAVLAPETCTSSLRSRIFASVLLLRYSYSQSTYDISHCIPLDGSFTSSSTSSSIRRIAALPS